MIIDFHTHVGDHRTPERMDRLPVTWEGLIERLDEEEIDKAVVLPSGVSPESLQAPFLFSPQVDILSQLKAAREYADRVIPFGNLDPRMGCLGNLEPHQVENPPEADFSWILTHFLELGCVGIGEITANIAVDDPRVISLFRQCGEFDLPVLFPCTGPGRGVYGLYDEVGLPRLERLLQALPHTTVIGHAPGFWAEIEGDITPEKKFVYPTGPIRKAGTLSRLLRSYANLYADISANSGFNAISRDKAFATDFLTEFQDKILFGTDVCFGGPDGRMPHLDYLRSLLEEKRIGQRTFAKITGENALKILKLYSPVAKPEEEKP
ncbi:MAG: amidohydrolase family protein [Spirochaetaceae bacterium]|nr:MAG: amidohydrolase family protein [Spirochaetaceae bacterium]